jgi:polyisoprenyl-phosphate glycosyltransferase
MPVYEDWESLSPLLERLDAAMTKANTPCQVLAVDDGSISKRPAAELIKPSFRCIQSLKVLRLRANLGHQRAIAIGLSWLSENAPESPVVVMDSDGEDAPEDVVKLLEVFNAQNGGKAVFAARSKRSESMLFVILYNCYKLLHRMLTGKPVKVGNFSIIPAAAVHRLVVLPELWNHYSASAFKSRFPVALVPVPRSTRIAGKSTMNLVSLTVHGLSGLSVSSEVIGVRLLVISLLMAGLSCLAVLLLPLLSVPGFVYMLASIYAVGSFLMVLASTLFILVILTSRDASRFLPLRDYRYYIDDLDEASP